MITTYTSVEVNPANGIVTIQLKKILYIKVHRMPFPLCALPTPITDELMIWLVLTGTPERLQVNRIANAETWAAKECTGLMLKIPYPTVFIILVPPIVIPMARAAALIVITHSGMVNSGIFPAKRSASEISPMAFWESFVPCDKPKAARVIICVFLKYLFALKGLFRSKYLRRL